MAPQPRPPPPAKPAERPQFFVDHRKGEVQELRQMLRMSERDGTKRTECLKKVIALMTLGVDVSAIFGDVVMCSSTTDIVQKKMIYTYITSYAAANPELTLLAVNTLQKDCKDTDPFVRGLALRCFSSLDLKQMFECLENAVRIGLTDNSGYVRRNAVMGCIRISRNYPDFAYNTDIKDILYPMLLDSDPQVSTTTIYALNEMLREEGGLSVTRTIVSHLLNRIKHYNEWGQCAILNLVSSYIPESKEEMYDIMNMLEDRFKHSTAAVVLGCTKCFLELAREDKSLYKHILNRLRSPLLTLMSTSTVELAYTIVVHIRLLLNNDPENATEVMAADFKHFYCRFHDPLYLKSVKLDILPALVQENTANEILAELSEYVFDPENDIGVQCINAIGTVALKLPSEAEHVIEQLSSFFESNLDHIMTASILVMQNLLRQYPHLFEVSAEILQSVFPIITSAEGLGAIAWILGEFGMEIEKAPYLIEDILAALVDVDGFTAKLELITAAVKLFIKRPGEMQPVLGAILQKGIQTWTHPEVHDLAFFYYRLLNMGIKETQEVVCSKLPYNFRLQESEYLLKHLLSEFNTISVVLGMHSSKFIKKAQIPIYGNGSRKRISNHDSPQSPNIPNSPKTPIHINNNTNNNNYNNNINSNNNNNANSTPSNQGTDLLG